MHHHYVHLKSTQCHNSQIALSQCATAYQKVILPQKKIRSLDLIKRKNYDDITFSIYYSNVYFHISLKIDRVENEINKDEIFDIFV